MNPSSITNTLPNLLLFTLLFILFTAVGTISHEYGHIFFATILGYQWELHFASMNIIGEEKSELHALLISGGGSIQTMLTGTFGYFMLRKSTYRKVSFSTLDYLWLFLALFWLRQVFNLLNRFSMGVFSGDGIYFGGDETRISSYLELHQGFFSILYGLIGLTICFHTFFFLVKKKDRTLLIASGIIGSLLGFWTWMIQLGPLLLP
ncbi:MAG: hypothetical protein JKY48_18940 [Flavobacteriales bacterium]|nr:hypothetical protein [Flavobacteriales bacterium]